jgi:hypothetical protein
MRLDQIAGLRFFIFNDSTDVDDTNIGFQVDLPDGLQIAASPNATNTCGGLFSAPAGARLISLTGATLGTGQNCALSVVISATALGTFMVSAGPINSDQGQGNAPPARTLTVTPLPPTLSGSFSPDSILPDATATLRFAIANPNPVPLTGVAFRDSLPLAREVPNVVLRVASSPNSGDSCAGTWSAEADAGTLALSGASLAASGACAVSVDVLVSDPTAILAQTTFVDFTGAIVSNEGGSGPAASATLFVQPCGDDSEYCCTGAVCNPGLVCDSTLCKDPGCTDGAWGTTCALPDGGSPTPCCGALSCTSIGPPLTVRYECCDGTDFSNTQCCPAGTHVDPASSHVVCN